MLINVSPSDPTLEEQLLSIMDVLAKAAVSEISQLFSDCSTTLRLQINEGLKENESLRTRMKVMRSELFSLRLQTRSNASRAASRFALARASICKPRTKALGNERSIERGATSESLRVGTPGSSHMSRHNRELRILSVHGRGEGPLAVDGHDTLVKASKLEALSSLTADHSDAKSLERSEGLGVCEELTGQQQTRHTILIKEEEDIGGRMPTVEDAISERLHLDAPGSSHMSSHNGELRIRSVHGKGEGPLAVDGHDTLFNASEVEAPSPLSADHSVAKGLHCSERRVHLEERTRPRSGNKGPHCVLCGKSLKENEALRTRMKVMRSELFSLRLQTRSNASRAASRFALARANICKPWTKPLGNGLKHLKDHKADGSPPSHSSSKSVASTNTTPSEQETPDIILIKDEEDINGCSPTVEDCEAFGECSTQRGATSESLHVDAPGSSHMSSHDGELRILSVHGKGEGPLAVDANDTLFTASELEALSSLSPDHSITHDSLLSFNSGPSERAPSQGTQDSRGGTGSDGHTERLQCVQAASRSLKHAALEAGDKGRRLGNLGAQFPQQHNLLFPQGEDKSLDSGERFLSRKELVMHRASHKEAAPIPCALCGKSLANKAKLRMHMRIHTGERPYGCVQCGKRFTQSGSLKIHLRTHSGEKPCVCLQCNARFSDPSSLRRHMVKHIGNEVI
ncbi:unnamed protein product [Gadus morhua 'NCC']